MIIEVTGIGYANKGAELMLCAVAERLGRLGDPEITLVAKPSVGSELGFRVLGRYGCLQKASLIWKGLDLGTLPGNLLPRKLLRSYGFVADKEIEAVLDASGLKYSDKWGIKPTRRAVSEYARLKKRGGKLVLLPQAFGPFTSETMRDNMRRLHEFADLIYARDPVSYRHLTDLSGESSKIKIAPDFTALVRGTEVADADRFRNKMCVIPNQRMLDKTSEEVASLYLDALQEFIKSCQALGWEVFVLNHEGEKDHELCLKLSQAFDPPLPYTGDRNAKEIKGLIHASAGVLTSRFHGLVSALTQGVPVLATSWSHKYEMLLKDFDAADCLVDVQQDRVALIRQFESWIRNLPTDGTRSHARPHRVGELIQEIESLWNEVFRVIGLSA